MLDFVFGLSGGLFVIWLITRKGILAGVAADGAVLYFWAAVTLRVPAPESFHPEGWTRWALSSLIALIVPVYFWLWLRGSQKLSDEEDSD